MLSVVLYLLMSAHAESTTLIAVFKPDPTVTNLGYLKRIQRIPNNDKQMRLFGAFESASPIWFQFNDPSDDFNYLRKKFIEVRVYIPEKKEISDCVARAVKKVKTRNWFKKVYNTYYESADGVLDFAGFEDFCDLQSFDFIMVDAYAYNDYDFGNFLWGASMHELGFTYSEAKIASEFNAVWNGYDQWGLPGERPWHGLNFSGDSHGDQRAIRRGYHRAN